MRCMGSAKDIYQEEKMGDSKVYFGGKNGDFKIVGPDENLRFYLPIANEEGIKSCVTQNFGGDCKLNQNAFVLEPESIDNLHNNRGTRNIWCKIDGTQVVSLTGASAQNEYNRFIGKEDKTELRAGFMWQEMDREIADSPVAATVRMFAPLGTSAEVMEVTVQNVSDTEHSIQVVAAIPIYGRSADNLRDHRHVTALLNRISVTDNGIINRPVLSFDERGHQKNNLSYFVYGMDENGKTPVCFYPTVDSFVGTNGSLIAPAALRGEITGVPAGTKAEGKEALGGLVFESVKLAAGASFTYTVLIGVTEDEAALAPMVEQFKTKAQVDVKFEEAKKYWVDKVNVSFHTSDNAVDNYLKWICFQPILRRIYGCSFLPYHDYGKGGRGWRDLWQDCLSLLIMDPTEVRSMIVDSFQGVRMDGTNATIIGSKPGEFIADRNNITRVWMDHAFWPFVTTKLYIDQTGDIAILNEEIPYFKDPQVERGNAKDLEWTADYGMRQKDEAGQIYKGSIIEHILLQNICAFYEVGDHNIIRLRGADWNDALDMAADKGESVAFTCAYVGNLRDIADLLEKFSQMTGKTEIEVAEEMKALLLTDGLDLTSIADKNALLADYAKRCRHNVSGKRVKLSVAQIIASLREKADWYADFIVSQEWVGDGKGNGWFNGYYDNHGNAVEGVKNDTVRMMLTGQVFSIMSGVASDAQVADICKSADAYLYKKEVGGYRLNTDFKEEKFDLGRMFGFAYGEKENGAVFSHMAVMYANALYKRGFVKEGNKVLDALLQQSMNTTVSLMYPGIPEYFDAEGVGKYGYLTGAASWYMLTMITEIYGIYGNIGDLVIEPKLLRDQFDENGKASLDVYFQGKLLHITYSNAAKADAGEYEVKEVIWNGSKLDVAAGKKVTVAKSWLDAQTAAEHTVEIVLK